MRSSYNRIASLAFACLIGLGPCGIAGAEAQCFTDSRNCIGNSYCSNFASDCNQYDFEYTYSSGCSSRWNARCRKVYRRGQCSTVPPAVRLPIVLQPPSPRLNRLACLLLRPPLSRLSSLPQCRLLGLPLNPLSSRLPNRLRAA